MQYGDNITSAGQRLIEPVIAGYNGTDFDPVRDTPDNSDGIIVVAGGQAGAVLRVLAQGAGFNGTSWDRLRASPDNADAIAALTLGAQRVLAVPALFNGTSFDRARGNVDNISLAALTNSTTTPGQSADQLNPSGRGVKIFTNVTAISGAGASITVTIQGKDPVSGSYFNILSGTAISAVGTQLLTVYPGLTASANSIASDLVPRTWRISYTLATNTTISCTIGGMVLL